MGSTPAVAQHAKAPQAPAPSLPFVIASRKMSRFSFTTGTTNLAGAAPTPLSPVQIPAVGYLSHINLEVTVVTTGGTSPTLTPDAPFNVLQSVEFKTASGNDIIAPLTGYQLYLVNKYGAQFTESPFCDARVGKQYAASAVTQSHFFLQIPLEIDVETALGSIPALASNRSYQLALILAAISTYQTGAPTGVTVTINGTAYYWSEPPAQTQSGVMQQTAPNGLGTLSQYQIEMPPITPGDKYIKSNNVGNVIRTLIYTLRNSSGARIDANGWPGVCELYLDNEPLMYLTNNEWEDLMCKWYQFSATTKDAPQGLDTGVYVIPFHALAGAVAGNPHNSRSQLLPTLDASQLQLRGTSFGSAASTLEIITNSIVPTSSAILFGK